MRRMRCACVAVVMGFLAASALCAGEETRKDELRKALKDIELAGTWIYDDIEAGFSFARESGKPLLVVFR